MSINNTVTLRRSTDVGMRWHNVIGQKEIELFPGRDGPLLPPGATIPLSHDVTDASIDTFLNSLGPVLYVHQPERRPTSSSRTSRAPSRATRPRSIS